jgi:hypothetical protein
MMIEIKNVVYSERLSEETAAFSATIYINGKKRGDAKNAGHGGMTMIFPRELAEEIEAHAKSLPQTKIHGMLMQPTADTVIDNLLFDHLMRRNLKRQLAKKTIFVRGNKLYTITSKASFNQKDASVVLNDLPFDEALKIFSELSR